MAKPAVILVGADKGGVGKTTVSRTLARLLHGPSGSDPRLRYRSAEGHAEALPSGPHRYRRHDQGAGPDEDFRHAQLGGSGGHVDRRARRLDVADPAGAARHRLHRGGQEGPDHLRGVPHPRARSIASLDEIAETAAYLGDAQYFLVKNFINKHPLLRVGRGAPTRPTSTASRTRSRSPSRSSTRWRPSRSIWLRCRIVTFIANKKPGGEAASYSFVLRGYVRHWLGNVWAEYDRIKLTDIVGAKPQDRRGRAAAGSAEDPGCRLEHDPERAAPDLRRGRNRFSNDYCQRRRLR